ncbi:MAG: hypothetical protein LBR11_04995 [Deltaproteobacteria bacterium]|jgi:division/cell wall cluster transcriptional repressor MraZ|nr:hypothetical protein [Deltaproteobacteria bacterium]
MSDIKTPNFKSNFPHALDDKGRLTLPSPLREEIIRNSEFPERLYLSYFPGNRYLSIYTHEVWKDQSAAWNDESRFPNTAIRVAAQRLFFSNVEPVTQDKAGRILIPANYRERVGLAPSQKVLVNGVGKRIEVWAPEEFVANELKDLELWQSAQAMDTSRLEQVSPLDLARLPEC